MDKSPYRVIAGKMPSQKEMSNYTEEQWLSLLRFCAFFLDAKVEGKPETEYFKVTDQGRTLLEDMLNQDYHPWHEFIYRIGNFLADKSTNRQYYYKLAAFTRICFTYLKRHPSLVSEEMKNLIEKHPKRMGYILVQYKVKESPTGDILQRDTNVLDGNSNTQVKLPSVQQKMMNSMITLADIYENLANSVKISDLKKMKIEDRLYALKSLSFIFGAAGKKMAPNHFTQININTKNVKELESAMLDYTKKTQEDK